MRWQAICREKLGGRGGGAVDCVADTKLEGTERDERRLFYLYSEKE